MALKTVLDSLDGVPEELHSLYAERDGKFVLDVEGIDNHPAVAALRNGHNNSKRERQQALDDLKKANDRLATIPEDFDPDEWERLKAEDKARQDDPDGKDVRKQIDAAVAATREQEQAKADRKIKRLEEQLAERDEAVSGLDRQLRERIVEDDLTRALVESGVTKGAYLRAAKALLERDIEVVDEDDRRIARMKPDLGGDDVAKFVANWVQTDDGKVFVEPAKGADANGSSRARVGEPNPFSKANWSKTAQGALAREDRAKAERLAKQAGFRDLDAGSQAAQAPV